MKLEKSPFKRADALVGKKVQVLRVATIIEKYS